MNYFLEAKGVSKNYNAIKALDNVDFKLKTGEVHCLVGENGAGKSTLGKALVGITKTDSGSIFINGEEFKQLNPIIAKQKKVSMVTQELNLMQHMSIAENIFMLEDESYKKNILYNKKKLIDKTKKLFEMFDLGTFPSVTTKVSNLTHGQQQIVEIMRAVGQNNNVIIFDEPTTSLSLNEVDRLFALIKQLKKDNVSIVLVTHKFDEIFAISDIVTVLCDGKLVKERIPITKLDKYKLVKLMVGRDIKEFFGKRQDHEIGKPILEVEGLSDGSILQDISFKLNQGEILGFAGLVGAGRTEIVETIFGIRRATKGSVKYKGEPIYKLETKNIIKKGIVLIPEDRKLKGLCINLNIDTNVSLTSINNKRGFISYEDQFKKLINNLINKLNIKLDSVKNPVSSLSGGNQQKVLLSKWISLDADLYIFDEPTKGIDVGTKTEIYDIIRNLARIGKSIIIVSSEMQEVIALSDRILVVNDGRIVGKMNSKDASEQSILNQAVSGKVSE